MEIIQTLLLVAVPSAIVFASSYFAITRYFANEKDTRAQELKSSLITTTIPLQLQAYERLILFLERISPESLLIRIQDEGASVGQFHQHLLIAIRAEFEHNMSQQLYVSTQTWDTIKQAKELLVKIINEESSKVASSMPASVLSEAVLIRFMGLASSPISRAIDSIKKDVSHLLS